MQQVGSKRIRIENLLYLSSDPVQSVPARLEIPTEKPTIKKPFFRRLKKQSTEPYSLSADKFLES